MDTQDTSASAGSASGGTIEPANRAAVAKEKFQTPKTEPHERYELRDPFADATYRSNSFAEIVAKADQLGSTRLTAFSADGKRTPITKSGSEWHRGPQLAALLARPLDDERDEPELGAKAATKSRRSAPSQPARTDVPSLAKVDIEAERTAHVAELEAALRERYVIKRAPVTVGPLSIGHTEYRFRGDTSRIAFTESTFRLATDTNSPSVARSMVDVAQARNWKGLRVAGSVDFRRLVWLEASVRGVKAIGYEPNPADLEILKREREARQLNRIEPVREAGPIEAQPPAEKASTRGSGGRKAVLVAIEALLVDKHVPEAKREAVLAAATEQLAQRIRTGQAPRIKVYDKAAPSRRPAIAPVQTPARDVSRSRERAAPVHVR